MTDNENLAPVEQIQPAVEPVQPAVAPGAAAPGAAAPEFVKVRKSDLDELTSRKDDLEKFFFFCATALQQMSAEKPSLLNPMAIMESVKRHEGKMNEIGHMINEIHAKHYTTDEQPN